ncbi:hypothetical protein JCM24511_09288 [Saitozyma sp. JCM 24511]|nr:hypothetical protein JCM24511_09288 [Saitozyma sp. JCM 24511]
MRFLLIVLPALSVIGAVASPTDPTKTTQLDVATPHDWPQTVTLDSTTRRLSNGERLKRGQAPAPPKKLWRPKPNSPQRRLDVDTGPSSTVTSGSQSWAFANCISSSSFNKFTAYTLGPSYTTPLDTAAAQCAAYQASDYPNDENGSKTNNFAITDYSGDWVCSTDVRSTTSEDCTTPNAGALYGYVM